MQTKDYLHDEIWEKAYAWVNGNKNIRGHVYNKHYTEYSAYDIADFMAEAYPIAYEAMLRAPESFEAYFWTVFKSRCSSMSNKPHKSKFVSIDDDFYLLGRLDEQNANYEYIKSIDDDTYIAVVSNVLNILTPSQRKLCRFIAFANEPLSSEYIAKAFNITSQAVSQRISAIIKKIKRYKELHGGIYVRNS